MVTSVKLESFRAAIVFEVEVSCQEPKVWKFKGSSPPLRLQDKFVWTVKAPTPQQKIFYFIFLLFKTTTILHCWTTMAGIFRQLQPFKEGENWQEYVDFFFFLNPWQMTLTMTRKMCAFYVQWLNTLSKVCVSQTSLKQKLLQLFVILSRTILNPDFLRLVPVFSSTLEAIRRRKVFRCSWPEGVQMFLTLWSLLFWTVCHASIVWQIYCWD